MFMTTKCFDPDHTYSELVYNSSVCLAILVNYAQAGDLRLGGHPSAHRHTSSLALGGF